MLQSLVRWWRAVDLLQLYIILRVLFYIFFFFLFLVSSYTRRETFDFLHVVNTTKYPRQLPVSAAVYDASAPRVFPKGRDTAGSKVLASRVNHLNARAGLRALYSGISMSSSFEVYFFPFTPPTPPPPLLLLFNVYYFFFFFCGFNTIHPVVNRSQEKMPPKIE